MRYNPKMLTRPNPVSIADLGLLNTAEQRFVQCVISGQACGISKIRPEQAISAGAGVNVIRAELIRFFAWGGNEEMPVRGGIIALHGAYVSGSLSLRNAVSSCTLAMEQCYFEERIEMADSKFRIVDLSGSYLTGGLYGVNMQVDKDMFMDKQFIATGETILVNSSIGGCLYSNSGEFKNLSADRLKVGEDWFMGDGFSAAGCVRFMNASIRGNLICDGGNFCNKQGMALVADGVKVGGNVLMRNNFFAEGEVRFLGARIGFNFLCDSGKFINNGGNALVADSIRVGNSLSLQNGFWAEGRVRLVAANIGLDLYCSNGNFKDKGISLAADGIKVGGNFFMKNNFVADGVVQLSGGRIGIDCVCRGIFNKGLRAVSAQIENCLVWDVAGGHGEVNLAHATVGILADDNKHLEKFDFFLYRFSYGGFTNPWDMQSRIEWLKKCSEGHRFSPQPFEQAAKVLFAMGHNNDARKVLLEKERLLTQEGQLSRPHKWLRRWWDRLAGYGYEWWRTLIAAAVFVGVGAMFFDFADRECRIVPHQPVVMTLDKYTPLQDGDKCTADNRPTEVMGREFPDYPRFHALMYSADVFIPAFALHLESHWYPQPKENDTDLALVILRVWYWIEIIAGWILTSVFVLTITGLLKPRQSSLE